MSELPLEIGTPVRRIIRRLFKDTEERESGWVVAGYDYWWGVNRHPSMIYLHEDGREEHGGAFERDA